MYKNAVNLDDLAFWAGSVFCNLRAVRCGKGYEDTRTGTYKRWGVFGRSSAIFTSGRHNRESSYRHRSCPAVENVLNIPLPGAAIQRHPE